MYHIMVLSFVDGGLFTCPCADRITAPKTREQREIRRTSSLETSGNAYIALVYVLSSPVQQRPTVVLQ